MVKKCPLVEGKVYWGTGDDEQRFPGICVDNCESEWDQAVNGSAAAIDDFGLEHGVDADGNGGERCHHDVEYGGETLQRLGSSSSARRGYATVHLCEMTGDEAFATEVEFRCQNN